MSKRCVLPGATKKKSVKDVTWIPNRGVSAPAFWSNRVFSKNPTLNTLLRHTHGWENLGKTWWSLLFDTWCIGLALVSTKVCPTGSHMVPVVCNSGAEKIYMSQIDTVSNPATRKTTTLLLRTNHTSSAAPVWMISAAIFKCEEVTGSKLPPNNATLNFEDLHGYKNTSKKG